MVHYKFVVVVAETVSKEDYDTCGFCDVDREKHVFKKERKKRRISSFVAIKPVKISHNLNLVGLCLLN